MSQFGERLAYYRDQVGMKQKTLAERIEIDIGHLNRIEKGRRKPPRLKYLQKIIEVLRLTEDEARELIQLAKVEVGSPLRRSRAYEAIDSASDQATRQGTTTSEALGRGNKHSPNFSSEKEQLLAKAGENLRSFDFSAPHTEPEARLKEDQVLRQLLVFADRLRDEEDQLQQQQKQTQQRLACVRELQTLIENLIAERNE